MDNIIKFKKPEKQEEKTLDEQFMETLSLEQLEMYASILSIAVIDQEKREEKYIKRIMELEKKLEEKK